MGAVAVTDDGLLRQQEASKVRHQLRVRLKHVTQLTVQLTENKENKWLVNPPNNSSIACKTFCHYSEFAVKL